MFTKINYEIDYLLRPNLKKIHQIAAKLSLATSGFGAVVSLAKKKQDYSSEIYQLAADCAPLIDEIMEDLKGVGFVGEVARFGVFPRSETGTFGHNISTLNTFLFEILRICNLITSNLIPATVETIEAIDDNAGWAFNVLCEMENHNLARWAKIGKMKFKQAPKYSLQIFDFKTPESLGNQLPAYVIYDALNDAENFLLNQYRSLYGHYSFYRFAAEETKKVIDQMNARLKELHEQQEAARLKELHEQEAARPLGTVLLKPLIPYGP